MKSYVPSGYTLYSSRVLLKYSKLFHVRTNVIGKNNEAEIGKKIRSNYERLEAGKLKNEKLKWFMFLKIYSQRRDLNTEFCNVIRYSIKYISFILLKSSIKILYIPNPPLTGNNVIWKIRTNDKILWLKPFKNKIIEHHQFFSLSKKYIFIVSIVSLIRGNC